MELLIFLNRYLELFGEFFTGLQVETNYQPEITYKVEMQHHDRNTILTKIKLALDEFYSQTYTYYAFGEEIGYNGNFPMRGVDNYGPIEYCLDISDFNKKIEDIKSLTPTIFSFIIDDQTANDLDPEIVPPGFIPMIKNYELIDYKYRELHIQSGQYDIPIRDDAETELTIVYERKLSDISENQTISDNIGLPISALGIGSGIKLTVEDGTKVYMHDTKIGLKNWNLPNASIEILGNADFIGFDDTTDDEILLSHIDLKINGMMKLKNCDIIIGENSSVTVEAIASIVISENSDMIIDENVVSDGTGSYFDFGFGSRIIIENGGKLSLKDNKSFEFSGFSRLILNDNNSEINFGSNSKLVFKSGSELWLKGDIQIPAGSQIILESGANLIISNTANVSGNIQINENATVHVKQNSSLTLTGDALIPTGSQVVIESGSELIVKEELDVYGEIILQENSIMTLKENSKLLIGSGTYFTIPNGAIINLAEGAEIIVENKGIFYATATTFNYIGLSTGNWLGINCLLGSKIDLNECTIIGAETGVKGLGTDCTIINSVFENCVNGIALVYSDNDNLNSNFEFTIQGNTLTGLNTGTGISLTHSDGTFINNNIHYFSRGAHLVACSPIVTKNTVVKNKNHGIVISGGMPSLINPYESDHILNNTVTFNGTPPPSWPPQVFPGGQIGIVPSYGNVYMENGRNNVYYVQSDEVPEIKCISFSGLEGPAPSINQVKARYNYWGTSEVTDAFVGSHRHYEIDYTDWSDYPFEEGVAPQPGKPYIPSTENRLLTNAVRLEVEGKYTASIQQYKLVIRRYEDSPEYFVAMARLPYVYAKAGMNNEELVRTYDEAIESEDTQNKKFYKEMKVTAHLKGRRYDAAIFVAEELKAEAQTEDEVILAEIHIAIANMLKESTGKSRGGTDHGSTISDLLSKLRDGDYTDQTPTGITESLLPERTELFQNYPNPFNPVTQIKFALAKTADVKLSVYNITGQRVTELANGIMNAGVHAVDFDGSRLNSGVYYYTLEVDGKHHTQKMILMK